MSCLIGSTMTMTMDLFHQTDLRSPSGAVSRTWDMTTPAVAGVKCMARAITSAGIRSVGSTERWDGPLYKDVEYVTIMTKQTVTKRDRVSNIKDSNGVIGWVNADGTPTQFDVLGVVPIFDPFSQLVEYQVLVERVQAS